MARITVHEAKTNLSELIRRAEAGEEIVISRGDKPVAVLKGYDKEDIARRRKAGMGCLAGKMPLIPDEVLFEPMSEEELAAWYGEDDNPTDPLRAPEFQPQKRKPRARKSKSGA